VSTTAPPNRPAVAIAGGLAAGLVAGLFGVGGGILLVPVLVLLLKRSQHVAHATSLVAVTLAALSGVTRFGLDGAVAVPGAVALAVGAVAGARLGAAFFPRVTDTTLRRLFAVVLLVLAVRFLLTGGSDGGTAGTSVPDLSVWLIALHVVGGVAAGIVSSMLGVGGGVIMVPLLALGFGYGQHIAEGTSLAVIVPTALTGAWAHHRNGYTDWRLGLQIGIAAVVGAAVGASVALGLAPATLARLFGVLQAVVAVLMFRPSSARGERQSPDRASPTDG
jgi:uncharacterized membrane protein YfcA